jgi:hypothetical protein
MSPLGYQQITSLATAVGLTIPAGATKAIVVAETQDVRWRDDGTAPTASVGMSLPKGVVLTITDLSSKIKFIETTTSAKLNVSYYG